MSQWPAEPFADPRLAAVAELMARWPAGRLPTVAALDGGLRHELAPLRLRLAVAEPPRRRARAARAALRQDIYELRIAASGDIPTRAANLHDACNALAWAAFPAAKLASTLRIAALQRARLDRDGRLPGSRDRDHDRLAMLDEGGLIHLTDAAGQARAVVIGHAIWQHALVGHRDVRAAAVRLRAPQSWRWRDADATAVRAVVDRVWRQLVAEPARLGAAMDAQAGEPIDDEALWHPAASSAA